MARNDKHGDSGDDLDFDFDDFNFDDLDGTGGDDSDPRSPRSLLKRFASSLKEEVFSPQARRQYLHDSLPQNYHTTLNAVESISDAASDLYNDSVLKEWEKSRGVLKRVLRADGEKLRKVKLGRLVDWAEQKDHEYKSDYNPEEAEIQRQMGGFAGDLNSAMNGGNLSPQERREFLNAQVAGDKVEDQRDENDQTYQETTVKHQSASVGLLTRILNSQQRLVDYQDQVDFNYKKKQIELGIRSLIGQRKSLELTTLMRAEIKEGLTAITKNTGLPDYVKITAQENAKRLLRDKMVNAASDWASSRLGGVMRGFMNQTKRNMATMGMNFREKAGMYVDSKEMMDGVGLGFDDILMSMGAGFARQQLSKRGGKHIRKYLEKNPKYTQMLDMAEAVIANGGSYANMALEGRSGYGKLDRFLERHGYSGIAQQQNHQLMRSNVNRQDESAFMDRKLKQTFTDVYPAWFSKIWKTVESIRTNQDPSKIDNFHYDFKFNRLRTQKDLQKEFDNETIDDSRIKNYNDGIDNWINKLDPKGTLTVEARATIRRWLISNHSAGRESFPVALYRGEGLPKGTTSAVRAELDEKIPYLAGFDPIKVSMIMEEGVGLELKALRENPDYRRMSKSLGNADAQARSRHPIDNNKLARMTERYGANFAVNSGLAKYDREGNINIDNENIVKMVSSGGNRRHKQRSQMDAYGDITPIEGVDQRAIPEDSDRVPFKRMNQGTDRDSYNTWANAALSNINGARLRGFASGGFTGGKPDEISGVTHGDEAVIDSTGTKNNKRLLAGIMKLGAPVIKNGKINRTYYRILGFKNPEQVDMINRISDMSADELKDKAKEIGKEATDTARKKVDRLRDKFKDFRNNNLHQDGYIQSMGPTPEFMGPVRTGGMRNKAQEVNDLLRDPEEIIKRLKLKERAKNAADKMRNFKREDIHENIEEYRERAKEAVRKANTSRSLDFDATSEAIDNAIREGKVKGNKPISLFMRGQNSPFITKGDFATGRYQNKTTGKIITTPADIMDDIVMVDGQGNPITIATMADMLEGVFDSRGNQVILVGLDEGYRKYIKRSTLAGRMIKNSKLGKFVGKLKEKIWDDQPVDVCIIVGGNLVTVLKATGFNTGQYLDAEQLDVLKSHNDIRGAVVNQQGETLLTVEELANGIYDTDGYRLKISKLKHWRNVAVTKIENFVKKQFGELKNRALSKALSWMEKTQSNDVYVMRWNGTSRQLTKAFAIEDMDNGMLLDVKTSTEIKKINDITGPVYSKVTKSVVVKEDEIQHGFFNEDGSPYKDWKGMSIDERLEYQKDRVVSKIKKTVSGFFKKFKEGYKGGTNSQDTVNEDTEGAGNLADGEEPCDVYIIVDGDMQLKLSKQGFLDHDYRDVKGSVIEKPKDLLSTVFSSAGRIILTTEQITNGVYTESGQEIKTMRKQVGPSKQHTRANTPKTMSFIKNLFGINKERETVDGTQPIDVFIFHEGKFKRLLRADNFNMGSYKNAAGEVIKCPADIDGEVYHQGNVILTEDELQKGIFNSAAKIIKTEYYKKNGVPGAEGFKTKLGRLGKKLGGSLMKGFGKLKDKIGGLREGSWQWKRAKKEEEERNKPGNVTVNVGDDKNKEKKGFLSKLLLGFGTMFGGMFATMMARFGKMFKNLRNAIMISKMASAAGGALGGGGGRGKLGLATKIAGGALAAGGAYTAYNAMGNAADDMTGDEDPAMKNTPEEEAAAAAAQAEEQPGFIGGLWNGANDATGGLAGEIATTAALGYGMSKIGDMRRARRINVARPGLASRFGAGAGRAAGAAGSAIGRGAADAGRAGSMLGRAAGGIGRFAGRRAGLAGRVVGGIASGVGKAARWALSPRAAVGRLGTVARMGSMALKVGKFALGAARLLSGPVGWGLMAATWIGGKLWQRYKDGKNPLMRFRMAQYGFDFDDEEYSSKLLDLENLLKDYVVISGEGKPSIKDNFPEDQVFQLFEITPNDPNSQEHVQRFIAWWIKRFKPVYLSYVKQTKALLNKTDISKLDEELGKKGALTLLKGVNFTNQQNNPYAISASPFKDPAETPLTLDDVNKAYEKALGFANKLPDESEKATKNADGEEVKSGDEKAKEENSTGFSWLDNSKEAIKNLADNTLKVTKVLATKTDEVFGGWFSRAATGMKTLWTGLSDWLTNATGNIMKTISSAWEGLKSFGSDLADGAADAGGAVVDGAAAVGNTIVDAAVGTYEKITGTAKDNQLMVYKAFVNAGLSDNQARIMTAEVGRENGYQTRYLFGGHVDANNGASNLGMISWQKGRATNLSKHLRSKGLIDASGSIVKSQQALDEQARFLVNEIKTDPAYKRTKDTFLANPNVPYNVGVEVVGRNFIRWDYDGKKINAATHHKRRDDHYAQISKQVGDSQAMIRADTQKAAAAQPVKAGQKQITTAEMKKLQTAAPKPATPLGPAAMKQWEEGETARKKQLAEARAGILKGTHVLSDAKPTAQSSGSTAIPISTVGVNGAPKGHRAVKAATLATQNAKPESTGFCAKFVANALQGAGYKFVRQNSAYQYANGTLQGMGFTNIQNNGSYQVGDVMVWPAHGIGKSGGAIHGHIQIFNGRSWVSDFVQPNMKPGPKYGNVTPSLWRDSTLVGKNVSGAVAVQGAPVAQKAAKETVADNSAPAKTTPSVVNGPAQTQQAAQRQMSSGQSVDNNAVRTSGSSSAAAPINTTATYQEAQQRGNVAQNNAADVEARNLQLQESRLQTGLLREIRDAVTGHRSDNETMGNKTIDNLGGMNKTQQAQVELISVGIEAMVKTLKDFNKQNKSSKLSDQFPVSAAK